MNSRHKTISKTFVAFLVISGLMLAPHFISAQMPEYLIDNKDVYNNKKKPAVLLDHDLHMAVADCMDCHHHYIDGENVLEYFDLYEGAEGVLCRDCHAEPGTRFREDHDPTVKDLELAYHSQCIGCHREMAGQNATGPRTCIGCHQE